MEPSRLRSPGLKVAIVCDWLVGGGAEKVVLQLHKMYPDAPIYASYCTDEWRAKLDNVVKTGYLQKWPFSTLRKFLPVLRHFWYGKLDLSGYDLVISCSGNGEAKHIKPRAGTKHICYCFTPTHFYWRNYDQYKQNPGFGLMNPLVRLALSLLVKPLRKWDYQAAQSVDQFIAISNHIKADIKQYYNRESTVIHPPVNTDGFNGADSNTQKRRGFTVVGRQVPYKRIDLAVAACSQLNLRLTLVGKGPQHGKLKNIAGPSVNFMSEATDQQIKDLLRESEAFIFPGLDDFGIAPVEAMAAGTPVIAYQAGGALDYVTPGKSGEFFKEQTIKSLKEALQDFDHSKYDPQTLRQQAQKFSTQQFHHKLQQFIAQNTKDQEANKAHE